MTIQDNKLIALFMGGLTSEMNNRIVQGYQDMWLPIHGICNWTTVELGNGQTLQYHKSWDWLKPVIDKIIEQIGIKEITECTDIEWYQYSRICDMRMNIKIEQAYYHVVEFIKWYNAR